MSRRYCSALGAGWRAKSGSERAVYLRAIAQQILERAQAIATVSARNNGKPLAEAHIDIGDAAATYEYYATLAEQLDARQDASVHLAIEGYQSHTRLEPAGVVGGVVATGVAAALG